jgi:hypothetical protein
MALSLQDSGGAADECLEGAAYRKRVVDALDFLADDPAAPLPGAHAAKSSFSTKPLPPREASLVGDGRSVLVVEVIGLLSNLGKSGLVWITTARERFLLQLHDGRVVYAQSDRPPPGGRLEILLARGALGPHDLAEAIAAARQAGQPLGAWLLAANRVAPGDLHAALREQVQQVFNRMFAAADSTYQFEDGRKLGQTDDVRLNVVQLLLESARAQDESLHLPLPLGPSVAG